MMKVTDELKEKAMAAKSADELVSLSLEAGEELSGEQAKSLFDRLHSELGEMSDEELNAVAGGGCGGGKMERTPCSYQVGDHIMKRGYTECYMARPMQIGSNTCDARYWRVTGIHEVEYSNGEPSYSLDYVCDSCGYVGNMWLCAVEKK